MKRFFLLGLSIILFFACQNKPQRYFEESAEIETTKANIEAYEAQNWEVWKSNFADTAKIFHNTNKPSSPDKLMVGMKKMLSNFSTYGLSKEESIYEMIIDQKGETWVNYWGNWKGKSIMIDKTLEIPVHLTIQFVNGKIVKEYAYYDTSGISETLSAIAAAKVESETETVDE